VSVRWLYVYVCSIVFVWAVGTLAARGMWLGMGRIIDRR